MNYEEAKENLPQTLREGINRLEAAINSAPFKKLANVIAEDAGLPRIKNYDPDDAREAIDKLMTYAALAQNFAVEELVRIRDDIDTFLARPDQLRREGQDSGAGEVPTKKTGWRSAINEAAVELRGTLEGQGSEEGQALRRLIDHPPAGIFLLPLGLPHDQTGAPDDHTELVTTVCSWMATRRINAEFIRLFDERKRKEEQLALRPPGWGKGRGVAGPTAIAQEQFEGLNEVRLMRPPPVRRKFAKRILKKHNKYWDKGADFLGDFQLQRSILPQFAKRWVDLGEGKPDPVDLEQLHSDWKKEKPFERKLAVSKIHVLIRNLIILYSPRRQWEYRAVLLPELTADQCVIDKWAEAASFRWFAENFDKPEDDWAPSIREHIAQAGSLFAGLNNFFRKGFTTLTKRKCKSNGQDGQTPPKEGSP
jgi:hypothetical protein